jgi:phosphoserine phosphatase
VGQIKAETMIGRMRAMRGKLPRMQEAIQQDMALLENANTATMKQIVARMLERQAFIVANLSDRQ